MAVAILQRDDDPLAPVLTIVPWPGMSGAIWLSDKPIHARLPPRLQFWHPELDRVPDHPRAGSCPLFSNRLIHAIWGDELGGCERFPVAIANGPEPDRQRTDFAAVHILPVSPPDLVDVDQSEVEEFVPGSPVWTSIRRLVLHESRLPPAPAFRIPQFRSAIFLHGAALERVLALRPSGVKLTPLDQFQADG
jgi:hypothetical protein